ncbi:MAG: electron transfer flavoprotein subunit beta/FixA family protein [Gemmatimonadota bacterium]
MEIVVCVKRVPDTETRVRIDRDGKTLDASGVKYVMSPYDEFAVEAALRKRDEAGEGEVTVVTVGGADSAETLRTALAMGADRAILLEGEVTQDGLATARALADEIGKLAPDLVLLGVMAADHDQQQVGPMLAVVLDHPCVTGVSSFDLVDGRAVCRRGVEGGTETLELPLPSVITITKGEYEPRYASLKGIMAAKRKPLETKAAALPDPRLRVMTLELPPERTGGRIVGEGPGAAADLVRLLREEANVI